MSAFKAFPSTIYGRSKIQLLNDLRFNYAVVSSGLILFGFFWNKLDGFDWPYVALIVSIFCANVFGFVVNDFYDAPSDAEESGKEKRNVFCSAKTRRLGKAVLYVSVVFSLLLGGLVSTHMLIIIGLFNLLAYSYSAPPVKLRNRPYWDWIFVFLWKGIIIFAGYFYFFGMGFPLDPFMLGTLVIVLLPSLISQINNQIRDFETDKLTNTKNSVQRLGSNTAVSINHVLSVLFYSFSFVFCCGGGLYVTMSLILINASLYGFVHPSKHDYVIEFANIWVVALFLEHFMTYFSASQQLLFALWIVVLTGIALRRVKSINLFTQVS
jgi:4-hydroxybenzoate polyprenyltransferase